MEENSDKLFIQGALSLRCISPAQIENCKSIQQKYLQQGLQVSIVDILHKRGIVTKKQITEIWTFIQDKKSASQFNQTLIHPPVQKVRTFVEEQEVAKQQPQQPQQPQPQQVSNLPWDIKKGSQLDSYTILEEIGRGGMGIIYKAKEKSPERFVAIKILSNLDAEVFTRFHKEIQITAELDHPNIVKLYNAKNHEGIPYIVMAYVNGCQLSEYLRLNSASIEEKAEFIEQIAQALHYAHLRKIIHRDIKPGNIMVTHDKRAMLMDFGIARVLLDDKKLTRTGELIGTPRYMAPERAIGHNPIADERTDIYSLGAVLYEILCGCPMVPGNNPMETLYNLEYNTPVPLSQINPKIPASLEAIWAKSVARNRNYRYASAQQLAEDLQKFLRNEPVSVLHAPPTAKISSKAKNILVALILVVIVVLSFFLGQRLGNSEHQIPPKISPMPQVQYEFSYVESLMQQGFYDIVEQNLEKSLQKEQSQITKREILANLVTTLVELKNYPKALQYYDSLTKELQNSDKVLLAKAKALYYLGNPEDSQKSLQKILEKPNVTSGIIAEALYYKGLILYQQQSHSEALQEFLQSEKIFREQGLLDNYRRDLWLFLGICLFYANNEEALEYLEKSQAANDSLLSHEFIGRHYLRKNDPKASEYFQTCVTRQPNNSEYHSLYGESLEQQSLYKSSQEEYYKALEHNIANFAALEGILRVGNHEISLRVPGIETLRYSIRQISQISRIIKINLATPSLENLERIYYNSYHNWKTAPKESGIEDIEKFVGKLISSSSDEIHNSAIIALTTFRYHSGLDEVIKKHLQSLEITNEARTRLEETRRNIEQLAQREQRFAMCYGIIQIFLSNDARMKKEIEEMGQPGRDILREILANTKENLELRYLAAKTLLLLGNQSAFDIFSEFLASPDPITATLCISTMREMEIKISSENVNKHEKILLQMVKHENSFLRSIVAQNLDPEASWQPLWTLMGDRDLNVKLYAAARYLQHKKDPRAIGVLQLNMRHPSVIFRRFSHNHFWKTIETSQVPEYGSYYLRGLQDQDEYVKILTLAGSGKQQIPSCIEEITELTKHSNGIIRILALDTLIQWGCVENVQKIIFDSSASSTLRLFAILRSINHQKSKIFTWASKIPQLFNDPDPHLRASLFYILAELGDDPFQHLVRESDSGVQANLLLASGYKPLYPLSGFGKTLLSLWKKNTKLREISSVEAFLGHRSENVRKAAALGAIMFAQNYAPEHLPRLRKKFMKSPDPVIKEGAALGYYYLFYRSIFRTIPDSFHPSSLENQYTAYIKTIAQSARKISQWRQYNLWITHCVELHDTPRYRFEQAILYRVSQKYDLAVWSIKQALKDNPEHPRYLLEQATIYYEKGNRQEALQLLDDIFQQNLYNIEILTECARLYRDLNLTDRVTQAIRQLYLIDPTQNYTWLYNK